MHYVIFFATVECDFDTHAVMEHDQLIHICFIVRTAVCTKKLEQKQALKVYRLQFAKLSTLKYLSAIITTGNRGH